MATGRTQRSISGLVRIILVLLIGWLGGWIAARIANADDGLRVISILGLVAIALAWLGIYLLALNVASAGTSAQSIAIRRKLRRARSYLRRELEQPAPAIRDEWTPWLIALGLNRRIASWWRAHGGADLVRRGR